MRLRIDLLNMLHFLILTGELSTPNKTFAESKGNLMRSGVEMKWLGRRRCVNSLTLNLPNELE